MANRKKNPAPAPSSGAWVTAVPKDAAFAALDAGLAAKTLTSTESSLLKDAYKYAEAVRGTVEEMHRLAQIGETKAGRDAMAEKAKSTAIPAHQFEASIQSQLKQALATSQVALDTHPDNIDHALRLHNDLERIANMPKLVPPGQKTQFIKQFLDFYDLKELQATTRIGKTVIAYHEDPDPDGPKLFLPFPAKIPVPAQSASR